MILNNEEMMNINGGGTFRKAALTFIGAAVLFLVGILSGFYNPNKCNN